VSPFVVLSITALIGLLLVLPIVIVARDMRSGRQDPGNERP